MNDANRPIPKADFKAASWELKYVDLLLIVLSVSIVATSYILLWKPAALEATHVRIISNNKEFVRLPLNQNTLLEIQGPAGITLVEISDGAVRCLNSPGIQGICQRTGWLRKAGDTAVSLPNRVIIEVLGTPTDAFDSINF